MVRAGGMAMAESKSSLQKLQERQTKRDKQLARDPKTGQPIMNAASLRLAAVENDGFTTPHLNDTLYLHYKGDHLPSLSVSHQLLNSHTHVHMPTPHQASSEFRTWSRTMA